MTLQNDKFEDAINFNWSQFNENKEQFWAGLKQQLNLSDRDFKEMVRQFNLQYSLNTKKASAKELTSPYSSPPPKNLQKLHTKQQMHITLLKN